VWRAVVLFGGEAFGQVLEGWSWKQMVEPVVLSASVDGLAIPAAHHPAAAPVSSKASNPGDGPTMTASRSCCLFLDRGRL
jgi:hypothetical protein